MESITKQVEAFLTEWYNDAPTVSVQTSGSTGVPKVMQVEKKRMVHSAKTTCDFLQLREGDTALLCMPLQYIGAKMMVVRSIVAKLKLSITTPSGHPMKDLLEVPTFAAMTPQQVYNSLEVAEEAARLKEIKQLLIGGGAIDQALQARLAHFPNAVWSSYGMTETLSHIALRRLNGEQASSWYTPLPGVTVSCSEEGGLVIQAPGVCNHQLITNDLAVLNEQGQFRILGRRDNTLNSGGVKIQAEEVEQRLQSTVTTPFMITSRPDEKFGEAVVLLFQRQNGVDKKQLEALCEALLPTYWQPKYYVEVGVLPLTETGKLNRAAGKKIASQSSL